MKLSHRMTRNVTIALLATSCLLALAPAAQAGHKNGWRRYKGGGHGYAHHHDAYVQRVVVHESGPGPALAGLIGGFIIGTAVAHSTPVVVQASYGAPAPRYRYWDPYCDEWFVSLSACSAHCGDYRHPRVVKVFNGSGGECIRTMRWSDGAWYEDDRDWND